ncbi:MAG: hypothetical protein A2152_03570 [Candidatus Levybacteria bacterium RBG_16_35_6]|nr:MAG: hypothetical protein A2152_03570 [Candidatus Levybacteria bacterium RBG_16_35_6]OGH44292.1 MAG: hypothetical protein A3I49_00475 [Candidatus Levybacteria bacterium RIFCSPLOWO2_02_FULL_37_11]
MTQPELDITAAEFPQPETMQDLIHVLRRFGVNIAYWGEGEAKSEDQLLREIQEGESVFRETTAGELMRDVQGVGVDVFYYDPQTGSVYRLREDRQVFKDGRTRSRSHIPESLSEKRKPAETPLEAAERAVREELQIEGELNFRHLGQRLHTRPSVSYPGLNTRHNVDIFGTMISPQQYRSEGYTENRDGLTSYFVWEQFSQDSQKAV